jgi:hypothetical protein
MASNLVVYIKGTLACKYIADIFQCKYEIMKFTLFLFFNFDTESHYII